MPFVKNSLNNALIPPLRDSNDYRKQNTNLRSSVLQFCLQSLLNHIPVSYTHLDVYKRQALQ